MIEEEDVSSHPLDCRILRHQGMVGQLRIEDTPGESVSNYLTEGPVNAPDEVRYFRTHSTLHIDLSHGQLCLSQPFHERAIELEQLVSASVIDREIYASSYEQSAPRSD